MSNYYKAPTSNYWSTTLSGAIDDSVTTITLSSTTGLQAPGYVVINREDGSGNTTASSREVVLFTGISSNDLTGVTRAADSSTARAHADGSLVESVMTVGVWNDLRDGVAAALTTDGTGLHVSNATVTSTANIDAIVGSSAVLTSIASIARIETTTLIATNIDSGIKGQFVWTQQDALATSLATAAGDLHLPFLRARKNLTLNAIWAGLNSAPSTAAAQVNLGYRATPDGTHTALLSTELTIDVGEYVSDDAATPAVLGLTSLASGTLLYPSIDAPGDAGDLTLILAATERE